MYCKTLLTSALLVAAASATSHEVAPVGHQQQQQQQQASHVSPPKHEVAPVAPVVETKHQAPPVVAPVKHEQPPVHVAPAVGWEDNKQAGHNKLEVYLVAVGDNNGSLKYFPDVVHAAPGSIVQFQFHPKNHTVTESTFDKPCVAKDASLATPQRPGLRSGFVPVTPQDDTTPVYNVLINDTEPIWIFCGQQPHCIRGMSMVINPPNNPERTIKKYQEASALLPPPPGAPAGGAPPGGAPPAAAPPAAGPPAASPPSASEPSPPSGVGANPPAPNSPTPDIPAGAQTGNDNPAPATFTGAASKSSTNSLVGMAALAFGVAALL